MPLTKVLIKFMSPHPAGNVISAAALGPEILIPVGYGSFLTDTMRSRYNYFFHVRQLPTIIAEPVQLEKYLMGDIEIRLEQLLARYEARRPVVDISDADPIETMALGIVLRAHKYWSITVLDYRVRDSIFLPFFTTKSSGTGIGLALSRQIMVRQGGNLELLEQPETGYTVTFKLTLS